MNKSKKLISLLLSLTMLLCVFSPLFSVLNGSAETIVSELRLTSSTTSVNPGALPEFSVSSSSESVKLIASYSPSDSYWAVWSKNDTAWRQCNAQNPAVAVNDGITHYALSLSVLLNDGYTFDETTRIIFNGTDITSLGHTMIRWFSWGGRVYIDLGTAGEELPKYTLTYDANGGTGTMEPETVYKGDSIKLSKCLFTPPAGLSFAAWKIGNKEYAKYSYYEPTGNVVAKAVWTDKYITESRATMTPSSISNSICPNDLVFSSSEPQKYSVSLLQAYDLTDSSLNTENNGYPANKKFIASHRYALEFQFAAVGNYYEYDEISNTSTFYLNGKLTDISNAVFISGSTLRRMEFTANELSISQVSATVTAPVAGNLPNSKPVISTANVTFGDYDWYEGSKVLSKNYESFQSGHTYRLKIRANTVKTFSDSVIAIINGNIATIQSVTDNSIVFYLDFTLPGASYTITFNANGGSGNMSNVSGVSGYYTLPECAFTAPAGMAFKCWSFNGVEKNPYSTVNITANTIVNAIWENKSHQHNYILKYNNDYHYLECSCGERIDFQEHTYILKFNGDYHYRECSCGSRVDYEEHSFVKNTVAATETDLGYTIATCSKCSYMEIIDYTSPKGKLSLSCTARTAQAQKIVWQKIPTVTGYQVQISTKDGKSWSTYATLKSFDTTSYVFQKLSAGTTYKFRARFYITADGKNYFSPWSTTYSSPTLLSGSISGFKLKAKTATAENFSWNKLGNITGYQIQVSNAAGNQWGKYANLGKNTNSYTFKQLASASNYKFRIRFYKKGADGKNYFSAWSKTLASPTIPYNTVITKLSGVKSGFSAQWNARNATGYQILYSTNNKFSGAKYYTVKNAKTLKGTVSKLYSNRYYYIKVRTYKTINNTNYFSPWSKIYSVKTK